MRLLTGAGTPRQLTAPALLWLFAIPAPEGGLIVVVFVATGDQFGALAITIRPDANG